ncbi:ABC transporter ATP-binding protein [Caldalkalibacillus mannanilyticus]|uniref:ABC transporter ATP-binding protein n=1 Tax=Caldalkalibacillus mannanilyticus TaxID=1418 RepID=UPI000468CCAA|nr:ABC transporter ATP-binding protein [Caldalkalibacillus mannanilyticus]
MITIENVTKSYGKKKILRNVTLTIDKGEVYGLLGPNGAGKSTLLSILSTLTQPTSGTVSIQGYHLGKQNKQVREIIGYVPQDLALWEKMTVQENMRFWSKFGKKSVADKRLLDLCKAVQLEEKWTEKVSKLSGGMKRKLNIAVALIHDPDVLLMDEPTVGIDFQSKFEINQYIKQLTKQGKTIVYTTHDMNEIMYLCDRIGVLKEGRLSFSGSIEQIREEAKASGLSDANDEDLLYRLIAD